jgi:hypothetical protein
VDISSNLRLDWATHDAAAFACKHWHYSRCMPAGKTVKIGVWENDKYIGVVIFSRGANNHIGSKYDLTQTECCELTRVALREHATPVSRIVAIAIRLLRKQSPGLRLIVSYADPEQDHHGGIYQAGNWIYSGPSQAQRELIINGKEVHKRTANSLYGTASPEKLRTLTGAQVDYTKLKFKHTYLMPLTEDMRLKVQSLRKPFPKRMK